MNDQNKIITDTSTDLTGKTKSIPTDLAIRYGFLALLVGLILFFSLAADGFAGPHSAVFIFQSVAITGILALGVTCTLVVDGFDLSIGSTATSALMLSAYVLVVWELSGILGGCRLSGNGSASRFG